MTDARMNDNMTLAPGVVDTIISLTATETDGVVSIGTPASGFFARLARKPSTSGIETRLGEDGKLNIVLHIEVEYGHVLPELASNLREAVADALQVQLGIDVGSIDVFIDGISFGQN